MVRPVVLSALAAAATIATLSACGGEPRTALAVEHVRWTGAGRLEVETECARNVSASIGPNHVGTDDPEVTLWGDPVNGRCHPRRTVSLPAGTTRIVDGASAHVLELPRQ